MSSNSFESDKKALTLRNIAESRLTKGSAPQSRGVPLGREALSLLYDMASDPARSSDALRLLQELQVHQVELDLQREELENSEHEMRRELTRYKAMFELTPTLGLVTTREGRIIEANPAAGAVLETRTSELTGQMLHELVRPESHEAWREMLRRLNDGEQSASCELEASARDNKTVKLKFYGNLLTEGDLLLFGVVG